MWAEKKSKTLKVEQIIIRNNSGNEYGGIDILLLRGLQGY